MIENDTEKNTDDAKSEDPLATLQKSISLLQEELNSKNDIIGNINKNKDRLVIDLKKYKRINSNLKQQLEDERAFYMKEKEYYCKEMNVSKQMRKKQTEEQKSIEDLTGQLREIDNLKKDMSKLRSVLNETLEANYNLSVKFLRMKNTKYTLKARYKREQTENAKIISDLTTKLGHTKEEILHIISDKFRQSIPPSNKKYLQVVKLNTQLIHDNLNFQINISKLYNDIERIKAERIKYETNLRLQYARTLNFERKKSSDKMCEANLCLECDNIDECFSIYKKKESDATISSTTGTDFDVFSGIECPLYPKTIEPIRIKSAPDFTADTSATEDSELDLQLQNT